VAGKVTVGLDREMSTLPTLSCGVWPIYLKYYCPHALADGNQCS